MKFDFIHPDFRLNGRQFSSSRELIDFSKSLEDKSITLFLADWFLVNKTITVHTSGSTGKPKSIEIHKKFMVNSALATAEYLELPNKTSALLALSIQYIAGKMMFVRALINGWNLDIVSPTSFPLSEIKKNYDFTALVPLQVQKSLEYLHKIDKVLIGGGAVSSKLLTDLQNIKSKCFASYGMTETVTHIAIKTLNGRDKSTTYHTLPNVIIEKEERGCLVVHASKIALEKVITNDLVDIITENEFRWLGRIDNVINSGGIKLIPEEIEDKLSKIIQKSFFVTSIKDELLGHKLVLIIEGEKCEILKKRISILETLTKFQRPKEVVFIDKFIYTETKKINRKKTWLKVNLSKLDG